jgi:TonB family protein
MSAFVVTTSIRGATKTQVWEPHKPLALGHPFRWVLERTESGVRLRSLGGTFETIQTDGVRELTEEQIRNGTEVDIAPYRLKIRPVVNAPAAFDHKPAGSTATGSTLMVYQCLDRWLVESRKAGESYTPKFRSGKAPFLLKKSASGYTLKAKVKDLHLHGSQERALNDGETLELSLEQLSLSTLSYNAAGSESSMVWRFSVVDAPEFHDQMGEKSLLELEDASWFRKSIQGTAIGFAALLLLSWLWPAPKEDPKVLIPAQFTKIVMAPQPKKAAAPSSSEAGAPSSSAQPVPKKVQDAAVVQAFRAKALSNAVNGLLKGGMTKLLAQSDFATGTTRSAEARKLFDTKNNALKTAAPMGAVGDQSVEVAALGGDAKGVAGANVGYGKGDRASVKGQGKGFTPFVSADANGSVVDEGLTKDEVGEVIHRHLSEVRYCYESAMIRTPDIEGKLMTNFTINGQGVVKSAEVKSSTLPDPRLDDCIIRRLATWKFPKPRGGVDVSVTYPFIFKTLGR